VISECTVGNLITAGMSALGLILTYRLAVKTLEVKHLKEDNKKKDSANRKLSEELAHEVTNRIT
jgi:hypothetical protein